MGSEFENIPSLTISISQMQVSFNSSFRNEWMKILWSFSFEMFENNNLCIFRSINDLGSVFQCQSLITYNFSVFLKFRACYITGQWGEFTASNATLYLHMLSWYFFFVCFFVCLFFIKKLVFLSFLFLF